MTSKSNHQRLACTNLSFKSRLKSPSRSWFGKWTSSLRNGLCMLYIYISYVYIYMYIHIHYISIHTYIYIYYYIIFYIYIYLYQVAIPASSKSSCLVRAASVLRGVNLHCKSEALADSQRKSGWWFPICRKMKDVPNHQPEIYKYIYIYI